MKCHRKTLVGRRALAAGLLAVGAVSSAQEVIRLTDEATVSPAAPVEFPFDLDGIAGRQVRLLMDARIEWATEIGNTHALSISVNRQGLAGRHLMNKPLKFVMREGLALSWGSLDGNGYRLMYAPDFSDKIRTDETNPYGLPDPAQDPFHFMWDLTPYVSPGSNAVALSVSSGMAFELKLRDVRVEIGDPISYHQLPAAAARPVDPAPTGPLPVYVPNPPPAMPDVQVSAGGGFRFHAGGRELVLRSRTSLPDGQWIGTPPEDAWLPDKVEDGKPVTVRWEGRDYEVERTITRHPDHIAVADTISNTGAGLVGVILEHRLLLPEPPDKVLFGGRESPWMNETHNPCHPTVMAQWEDMTLGLVAEDDIFRQHASLFRDNGAIGLADRSLGLDPGQSHTLEWSLYAAPGGDYWDWINAVRRAWGVNFTLEGPVAFTGSPSEWGGIRWKDSLTADRLRAWLDAKHHAVSWVMTHVGHDPRVAPADATKENQHWFHGTAIVDAELWLENTRTVAELMKTVAPDVKVFAYLHPNLCTQVGYERMYRDSVALARDGSPAKSAYKPEPGLFIPTLNNSYGRALGAVYRHLVDEVGANLYIDEITVGIPSRAPYAEWDGCTVAIDPATHAVTGKESMAALLMQPWYQEMMAHLKSRGRTAFANTTPPTRTMTRWRLQHFTEDFGASGIFSTHLSTPLSHSYKRGLAGFQYLRETLDHGGVAFMRVGDWSDYLFPITPIELRAGVVIAEERILTNRSGRFGWGDGSRAEVRVYDGQGRPVEQPDVREIEAGGEVLTEIRMPSDHLAILVRQNP